MTAGNTADYISSFVGKAYPEDKKSIFTLLDLVQEEIWNSGKFHGSTKWTYVTARDDNTIITPHGYNVLLGMNINFKPMKIRDEHFLFHQNGPADVPLGNNFSTNVYDLGEYPVFKLLEKICDPCKPTPCSKFRIGAKTVSSCSSFPKTRIYGNDLAGNKIFTYTAPETKKECVCPEEDAEAWDAIEGVELQLNSTLRASMAEFGQITAIYKEPSSSAVEYYAIDETGKGTLVARLDPFQLKASYRIYKVPNTCIKKKCIFGLFKRSKPDPIVNENQLFITENKTAILSIAKGCDMKFNRNEIQAGENFIALGIKALSNEVKEENSNSQTTVQFNGPFPKVRKF